MIVKAGWLLGLWENHGLGRPIVWKSIHMTFTERKPPEYKAQRKPEYSGIWRATGWGGWNSGNDFLPYLHSDYWQSVYYQLFLAPLLLQKCPFGRGASGSHCLPFSLRITGDFLDKIRQHLLTATQMTLVTRSQTWPFIPILKWSLSIYAVPAI